MLPPPLDYSTRRKGDVFLYYSSQKYVFLFAEDKKVTKMNLLLLMNKDITRFHMMIFTRTRCLARDRWSWYLARNRWRKRPTQDNEIDASLEMTINWIIGFELGLLPTRPPWTKAHKLDNHDYKHPSLTFQQRRVPTTQEKPIKRSPYSYHRVTTRTWLLNNSNCLKKKDTQ